MIPDTTDKIAAAGDEGSSPAVAVSAVRAGLKGRCPRCGQGRLFAGFLKVRAGCEACGLDYATIQTGDGPASFIMQIAGFLVGFSALAVEIKFHPPMWLHLIVWLPLVAALSLALMRPGRGLMIGLQYRNQSAPSTAARSPSPDPLRSTGEDI